MVCLTELCNLVFSLECLVSNGRQALLGGIRLGGSAIACHLVGRLVYWYGWCLAWPVLALSWVRGVLGRLVKDVVADGF